MARLRAAIIGEESILLGDLVLLEILQGARDDLHAARIERDLRCFPVVNMLDKQIATSAARNSAACVASASRFALPLI